MTRDVGTQSTPPDLSSSSPSPASTPPIVERSLKRCGLQGGDSPNSNAKLKSEEKASCWKLSSINNMHHLQITTCIYF